MNASKSLRRPTNWQDFETLCKKLWGEIWSCSEIKKNGRVGQTQNGVDIYGIPTGETQYFGIQCKGKDEYSDQQFSQKEILEEINKAKGFKPELKKLYFTTTALKDAKIETFVREQNIFNKSQGFFEVHIFSWEDIVDLIDENKTTHDWYLKSQNFKLNQNAFLTFHNDELEINAEVKFLKKNKIYKQKIVLANSLYNNLVFPSLASIHSHKYISPFGNNVKNYSYYDFYFRIHNIGTDPIEEYKIFFELTSEFQELIRIRNWSGMIPPKTPVPYDTFLNNQKTGGKIIPDSNILVGDDSVGFDDLRIKPIHEPSTVYIDWKLISKDYKTEGKLKINFTPNIIEENEIILVEDPLEVRIVEGEIEDYEKPLN